MTPQSPFHPTEQPAGDVFVAKITGVGSTDADGYVPHAWQEQRLSPAGLGYVDHEYGRTGTTTFCSAYDPNKQVLAIGTYVFLRLRGYVNHATERAYDIISGAGAGGEYSAAKVHLLDGPYTAPTAIHFNGTIFDTDGYIVGDTFVVPSGGLYLYGFGMQLSWGGAAGTPYTFNAFMNPAAEGIAEHGIIVSTASSPTNMDIGFQASAVALLSAGDSIGVNINFPGAFGTFGISESPGSAYAYVVRLK